MVPRPRRDTGQPFLSSARFEVRIEARRRNVRSREVGFCTVSPVTSRTLWPDDRPEKPVHEFPPVVLRRALENDSYLFDWRQNVARGGSDVRDVMLRVRAPEDRERGVHFRLVGCWPCRWSGPALEASTSGVAYEEIELCFERIEWEKR